MTTPFDILNGYGDRGALPGAVWLARRGSKADAGAVDSIGFDLMTQRAIDGRTFFDRDVRNTTYGG